MPKNDVVMIRAKVETVSPERTQYKPYSTTLVFDMPEVYIEIPVPAEHVREEKDKTLTLTLAGWTIFLDTYASEVEKMHTKYLRSFQTPGQHRPY